MNLYGFNWPDKMKCESIHGKHSLSFNYFHQYYKQNNLISWLHMFKGNMYNSYKNDKYYKNKLYENYFSSAGKRPNPKV
jgi:hypothetical protein